MEGARGGRATKRSMERSVASATYVDPCNFQRVNDAGSSTDTFQDRTHTAVEKAGQTRLHDIKGVPAHLVVMYTRKDFGIDHCHPPFLLGGDAETSPAESVRGKTSILERTGSSTSRGKVQRSVAGQ